MTDLAVTAARLLKKFGEPILISSTLGNDEFDPITGDPLPATAPTTILANAYLGRFTNDELADSSILTTDAKAIVEVKGILPEVGWFVEPSPGVSDWYEYFTKAVGSNIARIMNVRQVRRSGKNIIFILQLRAN